MNKNLFKYKPYTPPGEDMSEKIHDNVSNKKDYHYLLNKIFKRKRIQKDPDTIIDKKPQYLEKVLGWVDFDDELLDKVNQLEMEQWVSD